jgi:hypothetical protein
MNIQRSSTRRAPLINGAKPRSCLHAPCPNHARSSCSYRSTAVTPQEKRPAAWHTSHHPCLHPGQALSFLPHMSAIPSIPQRHPAWIFRCFCCAAAPHMPLMESVFPLSLLSEVPLRRSYSCGPGRMTRGQDSALVRPGAQASSRVAPDAWMRGSRSVRANEQCARCRSCPQAPAPGSCLCQAGRR